jgi:hypothetical protein
VFGLPDGAELRGRWEALVSDDEEDYSRDYAAGLAGGLGTSPGYIAGQQARANSSPGWDRAPMRAAGARMADEFRAGRVMFYVRSIAQTVAASVVVGLLAYGLATLSHKSSQEALQWALTAGGATAALFLVILAAFTVGVLLGFAFNLALLPFVLWRWLLAFGGIGAGVGYVLAATANKTSAFAQQQAIDFGLRGLLAGFVVGVLYRLLRGVTRRARPHAAPK